MMSARDHVSAQYRRGRRYSFFRCSGKNSPQGDSALDVGDDKFNRRLVVPTKIHEQPVASVATGCFSLAISTLRRGPRIHWSVLEGSSLPAIAISFKGVVTLSLQACLSIGDFVRKSWT
jgi:hypothetical protein